MAPNGPPPWLFNMQRYGPPPSYPGLRIPGVNAPLPPGYVSHHTNAVTLLQWCKLM